MPMLQLSATSEQTRLGEIPTLITCRAEHCAWNRFAVVERAFDQIGSSRLRGLARAGDARRHTSRLVGHRSNSSYPYDRDQMHRRSDVQSSKCLSIE